MGPFITLPLWLLLLILLLVLLLLFHVFFGRQEQDVFPQEPDGTGRSPQSVGGEVEELSGQKSHRTGRSPKSVGVAVQTSHGEEEALRIPGNHCVEARRTLLQEVRVAGVHNAAARV